MNCCTICKSLPLTHDRALAYTHQLCFLRWDLQQSHPPQGDGFQIHKIHRILHKWMNTISSPQFPHYANMQNIKSRPIRDSHGFKFSGLSRNCRNPQIIMQLIGNICDRYNKFSSQITFHPWKPCAPVKSHSGPISLT